MIRIINNGVKVQGRGATSPATWAAHVERIAVWPRLDRIFEARQRLPAEQIIERTVSHDHDDHIVNLVSEI